MTVNKFKNGIMMHGECIELMKTIPDNYVDMILCDLPYGTTACAWDNIIPFDEMWEQYWRIVKPNAAIVLTASQPFTTKLISSQMNKFKYEWIWHKSKAANFVHAKNMPIKFHENVMVFSDGKIVHQGQSNRITYNPLDIVKVDKNWKSSKKYESEHKISRPSHKLERVIEFTNYPTSIIKFGNSSMHDRGQHPTQKPVALFEYMIKTYTNENQIVLDNCAGSGTTAIVAMNTKRKFVGIEKDDKYYQSAIQRITDHEKTMENTSNGSE